MNASFSLDLFSFFFFLFLIFYYKAGVIRIQPSLFILSSVKMVSFVNRHACYFDHGLTVTIGRLFEEKTIADVCKCIADTIPVDIRLRAFGDDDTCYSEPGSDVKIEALPWNTALEEIRETIELVTGCRYNFVIVEHYPEGTRSRTRALIRSSTSATIVLPLKGKNRIKFRETELKLKRRFPLEAGQLAIIEPSICNAWKFTISTTAKEDNLSLTWMNVPCIKKRKCEGEEETDVPVKKPHFEKHPSPQTTEESPGETNIDVKKKQIKRNKKPTVSVKEPRSKKKTSPPIPQTPAAHYVFPPEEGEEIIVLPENVGFLQEFEDETRAQ